MKNVPIRPRIRSVHLIYNKEILRSNAFTDRCELDGILASWAKLYALHKKKKKPVYAAIQTGFQLKSMKISVYSLPGLVDVDTNTDEHKFSEIINVISDITQIPAGEILSRSRKREVKDARYLFFIMGKKFTRSSLAKIGSYCGDFDHTTVIHGIRSLKRYSQTEPDLKEKLDTVEEGIKKVFKNDIGKILYDLCNKKV